MPKEPNLRYELRAYEHPDCCRLASFLLMLEGEPPKAVDRSSVIDYWVEQYPRHAGITGKNNVPNRVGRALSMLRIVGILHTGAERTIEILDRERLGMVAGNLAIVQDDQGAARPPASWPERPRVPEHLQGVQAALARRLPQDAVTAGEPFMLPRQPD